MTRLTCIIAIATLWLVGPLTAQQPPLPGDSALYWTSVDRILAGDTLVDYLELRLAMARLRPRSDLTMSAALARARTAVDHAAARAAIDSAIRYTVAWAPAHNAAADSLAARGDTARAALHRAVARGLFASMEADRVRPGSTGIRVISVSEEYAYMRSRDLVVESQGLGSCGEYKCDTITARHKTTNEVHTLTFILTWWRN